MASRIDPAASRASTCTAAPSASIFSSASTSCSRFAMAWVAMSLKS